MKNAVVIWYGDPDMANAIVRKLESTQGRTAIDITDARKEIKMWRDNELGINRDVEYWQRKAISLSGHKQIKTHSRYAQRLLGYYGLAIVVVSTIVRGIWGAFCYIFDTYLDG